MEQRRAEVASYLRQHDGQQIRQRHIAASLGISQQMISRVLAQMIEEGAVARSRNLGYQWRGDDEKPDR